MLNPLLALTMPADVSSDVMGILVLVWIRVQMLVWIRVHMHARVHVESSANPSKKVLNLEKP